MNGVLTLSCNVTPLADGTDAGGRVVVDAAEGGAEAQIVEFFRAVQIGIFDRGNRRNTLSVTVEQVQTSQVNALHRYYSESDTLPTVATWTLGFAPGDGSQITASFTAKVRITRKFVGVSTMITYHLEGGIFAIRQLGVSSAFVIDGGAAATVYGPAYAGSIDGGNASDTYVGIAAVDGGAA